MDARAALLTLLCALAAAAARPAAAGERVQYEGNAYDVDDRAYLAPANAANCRNAVARWNQCDSALPGHFGDHV